MPRQYGQVLDIQDYNPYVFEGTTIAPKLGDVSFLAQSIKDREQRQANATIQQANLNKALGEARDKLNVEERQWFDDKQAELMQGVNDEIAAGNYSNAMNIAIAKAGELANDDELQQKIKANKDYTEYSDYLLKEQQAGRLSLTDYEYLKAINKYDFKLNKDWKPNTNAVSSFDEDTFAITSLQMLSETRSSTSGNTVSFDKDNGTSYTTGGSKSEQAKEPERLRGIMSTRFANSAELQAQARQRYNANMYKISELNAEIEKLKADNSDGSNDERIVALTNEKNSYIITNPGTGVPITDPIKYMTEKMIRSQYPDYMGYKWLTTSSVSKETPKGLSSSQKQNAVEYYTNTYSGLGSNVEMKSFGIAGGQLNTTRQKTSNLVTQFSTTSKK